MAKDGKTEETSEEIELEHVNTVNISVFGGSFAVKTLMYFGPYESGEESCAFDMWVDTGSSLTWVFKEEFEEYCGLFKHHLRSLGKRKRINYQYMNTRERVSAELFEGPIKFRSENSYIENQVFGIVDERKVPQSVRNWKRYGVMGILGLKIVKREVHFRDDPERKTPSVSYNLLHKQKPAVYEIGLDVGFTKSSSSHRWKAYGQLHFRGFKYLAERLANPPKMIAANVSKWGITQLTTMNTKIVIKGEGDMSDYSSQEYPTAGDTGSFMSFLPSDVIAGYLTRIGQGKIMFHYDRRRSLRYIMKEDAKYLKDLVLDFQGTELVIPPDGQVVPPSLFRQWMKDNGRDLDGRLYLAFVESEGRETPFILLGMLWCKFLNTSFDTHEYP